MKTPNHTIVKRLSDFFEAAFIDREADMDVEPKISKTYHDATRAILADLLEIVGKDEPEILYSKQKIIHKNVAINNNIFRAELKALNHREEI